MSTKAGELASAAPTAKRARSRTARPTRMNTRVDRNVRTVAHARQTDDPSTEQPPPKKRRGKLNPIAVHKQILALPLPPLARDVLHTLVTYADVWSLECWPSRNTLATVTGGKHERMIQRAIGQLRRSGHIVTRMVPPGELLPNGKRAKWGTQVFRLCLGQETGKPSSLDDNSQIAGGSLCGLESVRTGVCEVSRGESVESPPNLISERSKGTIQISSSSSKGHSEVPGAGVLAPGVPLRSTPPLPLPPQDRVAVPATRLTLPPSSSSPAPLECPQNAVRHEQASTPDNIRSGQLGDGVDELNAAVEVLVRWRQRFDPTSERDFTARWIETVRERLREGYSAVQLCQVVESAHKSDWNRAHAHRTTVKALFGSREAVEELLRQAPRTPKRGGQDAFLGSGRPVPRPHPPIGAPDATDQGAGQALTSEQMDTLIAANAVGVKALLEAVTTPQNGAPPRRHA